MIAAINRLFCNGINGAFIEKDLFPPAFIAITDDCPVRTIGADIVIDETDDLNPFGNHLDFSIAKITNPVHLGIAAKSAAVFLDPESIDTVLPFLLQIFIQNLIFDQCNQLLIEFTQINRSALNLQDFDIVFLEVLVDMTFQKASVDRTIQPRQLIH